MKVESGTDPSVPERGHSAARRGGAPPPPHGPDETPPQGDPRGAKEPPSKSPGPALRRSAWLWLAALLFMLFMFGDVITGGGQPIPYSEFKAHLAHGDVVAVVVGETEIRGTLRLPPEAQPAQAEPGAPADSTAAKEEPAASSEGAAPAVGAGEVAAPAKPETAGAKAAEAKADGAKAADAKAGDAKKDGAKTEGAAAEADANTATAEAQPAKPDAEAAKEVGFRTVRIEDPDLVKELDAAGVVYGGTPPSVLTQVLLTWILPVGLVLLVFAWMMRGSALRGGNPMMGFGKSRAKLAPEEGTGVDFDDVAGCVEAKQELAQMVEFLRNPSRFTALGGRIPKGVLLLGPPGTGKTLLARAVAGEAGVPFFSLSGSDFVEMFVGVGAARVRDLFDQAKAKAPCIVFVDEIDAIGRQRGVSMGVVNDEREQTLNQLLAEMDGFENNSGVILLAATNRPEVLDRALLRPGRFDRQVVLDSPDVAGREAILRVHVRGKPLDDDAGLAEIARVTPGMSGADLANVVNEAALLAADRHAERIGHRDLLEAVEKVVAGPERRSRRLEPDEKRRVAYHESGHALVASRVEHADPVQKITIVPRGRAALGYTMQLPEEEHYLRTREELLDRLAVSLGGRAAEELVYGDVSTGASDDLRTATDVARQMVCVFGMSERVGLAHCARPSEGAFLGGDHGAGALVRDCSEETSRAIDEEVRRLLEEARDRARSILSAERDVLERVATTLLETETLDRAGFERLVPPAPPAGEPPAGELAPAVRRERGPAADGRPEAPADGRRRP